MRPVRPMRPMCPMRPVRPLEQIPQTLQMQHMQHLPQPLQTLQMRHRFDLLNHWNPCDHCNHRYGSPTDAPQIRPRSPYAPCSPHHRHETLTFQRLWPAGSLKCLNTVELSPHHSVLQRPSKLPVDNMKRPPRSAKTWIRLHVKVHLAHLSAPDDV